MASTLPFEPLEHVTVNAKMHGCFAARHDDPGAFPEGVAGIRERSAQLAIAGDLTDEAVQLLAEEEPDAILRLTNHRSEHRCKRPGE